MLKLRNDAPGLDPAVLSYVNRSYPNNLNFSIRRRQLVPHRQLARRRLHQPIRRAVQLTHLIHHDAIQPLT